MGYGSAVGGYSAIVFVTWMSRDAAIQGWTGVPWVLCGNGGLTQLYAGLAERLVQGRQCSLYGFAHRQVCRTEMDMGLIAVQGQHDVDGAQFRRMDVQFR